MTLSQYRMLRLFHEGNMYTINAALRFDQRTFGSLCARKWVGFNWGRQCFVITVQGSVEFDKRRTHNFRKNNNGKFSSRVPDSRELLAPKKILKFKKKEVA